MPHSTNRVVGSFTIEVEAILEDGCAQDLENLIDQEILQHLRKRRGIQYADIIDCSISEGIDGADYRAEIEPMEGY